MIYKYTIVALALLVFNACGSSKSPDNSSKITEEEIVKDPPQQLTAEQLWARLKVVDFAQKEAQAQATKELKELSHNEEGKAIIRKLATLKEGGEGLIHKLLKGPINDDAVETVTTIAESLADDAARKAWFEQQGKGEDALSLLMVRKDKNDDAALVDSLTEHVIKSGVAIEPAIEHMWQAIRPARFALSDQARLHAMATLKRLSRLPAGNVRAQISRALTAKSDMAATNSGLLQSLVQGSIDADVYQVIEMLIADQGDDAAKTSFIEQKLGTLSQPAIYYLKNLNVSGPGNISPGARLSPLAAAEDPHLGKLIALFLKHGLKISKIFPSNWADNADLQASQAVFSLLQGLGQMDFFVDLLFQNQYGGSESQLLTEWIIKRPERAPVLKNLLSRPDLTEEFAESWRGRAYQLALDMDMTQTVERHEPVLEGANFLGLGAKEYYSGAVALENFNRLLDNDFGLSPQEPANVLVRMDLDYGTAIMLLANEVSYWPGLSAKKKQAVIRSISKRLKEDFPNARTWRRFVEQSTAHSESALGNVARRLFRGNETAAKELLLVN